MKQSFFLILLSFAFYFSSSAQAEVKISTATDKNQYFDTEYVYYSFIIENADIKEVTRPPLLIQSHYIPHSKCRQWYSWHLLDLEWYS